MHALAINNKKETEKVCKGMFFKNEQWAWRQTTATVQQQNLRK